MKYRIVLSIVLLLAICALALTQFDDGQQKPAAVGADDPALKSLSIEKP